MPGVNFIYSTTGDKACGSAVGWAPDDRSTDIDVERGKTGVDQPGMRKRSLTIARERWCDIMGSMIPGGDSRAWWPMCQAGSVHVRIQRGLGQAVAIDRQSNVCMLAHHKENPNDNESRRRMRAREWR